MFPAAIEESRIYSLDEIDTQLATISNLIIYASKRSKRHCLDDADKWLDLRLEIMELEGCLTEHL